MIKDIKELADKIWMTRKSRIIASERLNQINIFLQSLTVYYSIWIIYFSIWNIFHPNSDGSIRLLVISIVLTISQTYIISRRYGERYLELKSNYISMEKLQHEIEYILDEKNIDEIKNAIDKYEILLNSVENHNEFDYLTIALQTENKPEFRLRVKLFFYKLGKLLVALVLIMLPLLIYRLM